jgi:hypothetical protein
MWLIWRCKSLRSRRFIVSSTSSPHNSTPKRAPKFLQRPPRARQLSSVHDLSVSHSLVRVSVVDSLCRKQALKKVVWHWLRRGAIRWSRAEAGELSGTKVKRS